MKPLRIERNFEKRWQMTQRLQREIKRIYSDALKQHSSFGVIVERTKERVYETKDYLKIGNEGRAEVRGYAKAWFDRMMMDEVEWVHWYDGEFVYKTLPYGEGFDQSKVESYHVYKGSTDKL